MCHSWWLLITAGVFCASGCEAPQKAQPQSTTTTPQNITAGLDWLAYRDTYTLADFERPTHSNGFSSNAPTPHKVVPVGAATETSNALQLTLPPRGSFTLALEDDQLPRPTDWRNISSLGFSLLSPNAKGLLKVTLLTGPKPYLAWSQTVMLVPGWNTCSINLTTAAERIDLAAVHRVTWQWLGNEPAELLLDQVVLSDDIRVPRFADQATEPDGLLLMQRGGQLHVGVPRSFELVFDRGLIVGWYDRQRTIGRQRRITQSGSIDYGPLPPIKASRPIINLSHFVGLGPHPVPLSEQWPSAEEQPPSFDSPRIFAAWGSNLMTRQTPLEVSPQRVVLEAEWRFASASSNYQSAAKHRWRYTIYSTGDVFINVLSDGPNWPEAQVGYAVSLTGRMGFTPVGIGRSDRRPQAVLFERPLGPSDLLWTPHDARAGTPLQKLSSTRDRWLAAVTASQTKKLPIERAHWLHFGSCDAKLARAWAAAYQTPATLELTAGTRVTDAAGDLDQDGFNESTGVYELRPQAHRLRLTLHEPAPPYGVHLRIHRSPAQNVQAYQDGRRVERLHDDQDGLAVLTLNPRFEPPSQVEIFLSRPG